MFVDSSYERASEFIQPEVYGVERPKCCTIWSYQKSYLFVSHGYNNENLSTMIIGVLHT